jgi:Ca2+-binding RTX toxin-like protein
MEQEAAPKSVALVSEMGEVELSADGGLRISGINVHSALGRELGLVSGGRDYVIYEKGATAEIDGKTIGASYWSTQDAKSGPDGESLGASALDVALKFGTVVVGATSAMVGSAFGDTYSGRATDDHFDGAAGHDYISGRDGNDLLIGGSGDDKLLGGIGDDTLSGGAGNDMIDGGDGLDTLLLSGALADYWVAEQANGDLTLFGAEDTDTLRGIEQVQFDDGTVVSVDDLIREEEMLASIKMTSLAVSSQGDLRDAALNSDVSFAEAESGLNIVGINKSSLLGRDVALGEARGYVVHERGVLADTGDKVVGANYWSLQDNAANRGGEKLMDAAIDLALMLGSVVTNVNGAVIGSDFGDKFMGRNTDDIFFGGGGSDQIFADYGNDIVAGGAGNDLIIGGRGYDTALFSGEAEDYTLYNKNGQLVIKGNDGHDRLREIERLQFEDGAQFELADIVPETLDADWNVSLADYTPTSYAESDMLFV